VPLLWFVLFFPIRRGLSLVLFLDILHLASSVTILRLVLSFGNKLIKPVLLFILTPVAHISSQIPYPKLRLFS